MNYSLGQIIPLAIGSDGDDVVWIQMLVWVIIAALLGIYGLIKTRPGRFKDHGYPEVAHSRHAHGYWKNGALKEFKEKFIGNLLKAAPLKSGIEESAFDFSEPDTASRGEQMDKLDKETDRDLAGGMEMLELDLLLSIVENTQGDDKNDVMIRQLNFNELLRRGQLEAIDSSALKVYAINKSNLYNKDIQCEAMKELAGRTIVRSA